MNIGKTFRLRRVTAIKLRDVTPEKPVDLPKVNVELRICLIRPGHIVLKQIRCKPSPEILRRVDRERVGCTVIERRRSV